MKSDFRYLLDTDTASYIIRRFPKPLSKAMQFSEQFAISTITKFELARAKVALRQAHSVKLLELFLGEVPVINFDSAAALCSASVYQELEAKGTPIGLADSMIAGHALSLDLPLVTNNQRHFGRVSELRTLNWLD